MHCRGALPDEPNITDSNTIFRKALRDLLHFKFPSLIIEEAENGEVGRQKISQFHPQLLFIDIQLPEDGFKLSSQIQKENHSIIVGIFTNYNLEEYRTAALQAGISHVIPKNLWSGQGILARAETLLSGPTKDHHDPPRKTAAVEKGSFKKPQKQKPDDHSK